MWFKVGISLQPGSFQLDVSRGTVQGPSPLAGASVPWDLGGTKHVTGIVIPGLKCCFNFSDILRGLFPLHCQLHLAPVHGPQGEIQPEPLQGASPGEWDWCKGWELRDKDTTLRKTLPALQAEQTLHTPRDQNLSLQLFPPSHLNREAPPLP